MTTLVTGAAGFIGSNVCKQLLRNKAILVVGIDNLNSYYSPTLKKRRIEELNKYKNFIFIQSSFFQASTLLAIQKKYNPTLLIHAAAEVGIKSGQLNPLSYIKTNVLGTAALLETIGKTLHHIVLFSSSSVYGDAHLPFNEAADLHPLSVYGVSKVGMENYANNYYSKTRVPITIVRPFSVYGPDGRPDMLPMKLLFASLSDKTITITGKNAKRDWTYINDLSLAIAAIAIKPKGLQHVNIGFGVPLSNTSVLRIAKKIIRQYGYGLEYQLRPLSPIEMSATWADTEKLKRKYNITMTTPFKEGFQKTAEFFFSHTDFYSDYV